MELTPLFLDMLCYRHRKLYKLSIYYVYTMRKVDMELTTELKLTGIYGFIRRKVTPFGNGAKVDCPKEFLGKPVYLVILEK